MSTFVLVHGAFRGGWAWRGVRPYLVAAGHDVYAPSLIGAGELAHYLDGVTGLETWVAQVTRLVELEDLQQVTLVGHSQGGLVTAAVAARIPERISRLVHLDAAVPRAGERAVDLVPSGAVPPPRDAVIEPRPAPPDEYGAYAAATAAWVDARTSASPVSVALDPVPGVPSTVAETYVFCARTPAGYPSTAVRQRLDAEGATYQLIDAEHDAPLTRPDLVGRLLVEEAASVAQAHGVG